MQRKKTCPHSLSLRAFKRIKFLNSWTDPFPQILRFANIKNPQGVFLPDPLNRLLVENNIEAWLCGGIMIRDPPRFTPPGHMHLPRCPVLRGWGLGNFVIFKRICLHTRKFSTLNLAFSWPKSTGKIEPFHFCISIVSEG